MSITLIDFLLARIAEDKYYPKGIIAATWCDHIAEWRCDSSAVVSVGDTNLAELVCTCRASVGYHIARFDPARVLAECAAKRALVAMSGEREVYKDGFEGDWAYGIANGHNDAVAGILRALAAVHSSHPDYLQAVAA